ncbi:hypothetical protein P7G87_10070 [Enterococcus asini]|uniref:YtxH domain-containing protein n=1 Tax=Enterococcus asini TaxID=57732 RepID=A0AAW8TVY2_9ENTE|nr:hypothetical protein [Enterococcus asini]MCD5028190.1 hypothetical protein [Enterococcus asini]MDT2744017.1 hypothetical protein [Enterococcus asini]MDT2762939.1 hypothetical protein [Enterococcus asini]MDT2785018.1 hypothetical protein [Enterococcus asini]MDT2809107.1 hypothetical protein [Enterococcus asini]
MKTSTKVAIGLSVAAVAGIISATIVSESVTDTLRHKKNRRKVKRFVDDKFNGNERLLGVVDDLSDDDLDSLMNVMGKIKDRKKQVSVYGDNVKEATEGMKDKLQGFIHDVLD